MFFRLISPSKSIGLCSNYSCWRLLVILLALIYALPSYAVELRNFRPHGTHMDISVPVDWIAVDAGNDPNRIQLAFQVRNPASSDAAHAASVGIVIFTGDAMAAFGKTRNEATLDNKRFPGYVELEHNASDSEEAIHYQIRKNNQTTAIRENFLWNSDTGVIVVASTPDLPSMTPEWKQAYTHGIDILLGSLRRGIASKP